MTIAEDPSLGRPVLTRRDRFVGSMPSPHRHRTVELNLVISGRASYLLADRRYDLAPRSLVWLFPAQPHIMVGRTADYRDWLGLVPQDDLAPWCTTPRTAPLVQPDPAGHYVRRLSARAASALDALFGQVVTGSPEAAAAGRVHAVLAAWDAWLGAADAGSDAPATLHPAVREAVRLLCADEPPRDLVALARSVGLSPQHLSRTFLRETGVGVGRFRNEQRLRRFLDLQEREPDRPVLDLALAAGFGSAAQFHRVFRELTGTTPAVHLSRRRTARPR